MVFHEEASTDSSPVLHVENLGISYSVKNQWIKAIRDFHITVRPGEIVGLVGESGSGKSTVALGVMRYLAANGRIDAGSVIEFQSEDISQVSPKRMRKLWGKHMTLVPQNPGQALNPSMRVGKQISELVHQHFDATHSEIHEWSVDALAKVRLADPESILRRFPHELSGGMQQRVAIAMALITSPALLVLDEPTTALDVTTEATILDLVRELVTEKQAGALYVTHNLGVVAQLCDRVVVLYSGDIMEDAEVYELFDQPVNPYTIGLLNSVPMLGQTKRETSLKTIPGTPPSLVNVPEGCVYAPRCPVATDICHTRPDLTRTHLSDNGQPHTVRCHRWAEIHTNQIHVIDPDDTTEAAVGSHLRDGDQLLDVDNLTKHFPIPRSIVDVLSGQKNDPVRAVEDVSLTIQRGRTYGLVGESGSGKSTTAKMIIGLLERTSGSINLHGIEVRQSVSTRSKDVLAAISMVFQNPQDSLNPYLTVGQAIRRPLMKLVGLNRADADQEVKRLLNAVNLREEYALRYPGELSGGEKQRVAIARAFASNPELVIADEAVSSLDVSVQAAVLNLLAHLQEENETAYLFISHDLAVVGYLADYIAVMYLGEIMETGFASDLFSPPLHPYTEALVSAIPIPDPHREAPPVRLQGEIPSPRNKPHGCPFHTRCPRKIGPICEEEDPPWRTDKEGHHIFCHIPLEELVEVQTPVLAALAANDTSEGGGK